MQNTEAQYLSHGEWIGIGLGKTPICERLEVSLRKASSPNWLILRKLVITASKALYTWAREDEKYTITKRCCCCSVNLVEI